jgi:hypothetical protein
MLSRETLDRYRTMTLEDRWRELLAAMEMDRLLWESLSPEERARRIEIERRIHDEGNERMLQAFRRSRGGHP